MNGKGVLLYSNILIYISQKLLNFDSLIEQYEYFYYSIISYMEVIRFNFTNTNEKNVVERLFKEFE